jgi:predicted ATPase/transcriptional regulator with XRE-family HTH domain
VASPPSFGDWLEQRRKALGLTRQQLAQRVGCSVSALRKIEAGERRPSHQIAELLATGLELADEGRPLFVKVARGEQAVERLQSPGRAAGPPMAGRTAAPSAPLLNLPVNATPLIGRQVELAELGRLLADPGCRLISLVGPGGIGKTRLAIRAARRFGGNFPDGAAFVGLAPLSSASFIVPALADALGLSFSGSAEPQTQLLAHLRNRRLLLVLDNAEHLLADGAAELIAELLFGAPASTLLVTSREALCMQAEWVFVVSGLPVPDLATGPQAAEGSAVELFLQRAQRAHVAFVPAAEDLQAIARICQVVEGMPLAIELAAGWVRTLSCAEILLEFERTPDGLSLSTRDMPVRHRSLRAVFEHSWKLLSPAEQSVLMKLSVFRGGFTREAAEHVAGATLAVLSSLVAKSFARRGASGRYDLHELIRQYARDRLHASGAEEAARQAHVDWYVALAGTAEAHWYDRTASAWLNRIEQEHHNVREVLRWALEPAAGEAAARRIATGLELMRALSDYFFVRGHHFEALASFEQLLARPEASGALPLRVAALTQSGYFYYLQGRLAEARKALHEAFEHNQTVGDRVQLARGLEHLALVASVEGDFAAARDALQQSLGLWRELKAGFQQAGVLGHLGDIALAQHDHDLAERLYRQAIDPGPDLPKDVRHPYPPRRLAYLLLERGDCDQAIDLVHQSLRLNQAIHDSRAIAACLVALASVARARTQLTHAARLCGASQAILTSIGASLLPADQLEYERNIEALRSALSAADLDAASAEGRGMSLAQAAEFALHSGG